MLLTSIISSVITGRHGYTPDANSGAGMISVTWHLKSPPVFCRVLLVSFSVLSTIGRPFSFGNCIVCPSIYDFWFVAILHLKYFPIVIQCIRTISGTVFCFFVFFLSFFCFCLFLFLQNLEWTEHKVLTFRNKTWQSPSTGHTMSATWGRAGYIFLNEHCNRHVAIYVIMNTATEIEDINNW